jgi:hypothetical protein
MGVEDYTVRSLKSQSVWLHLSGQG